jgi:hypothetical protein
VLIRERYLTRWQKSEIKVSEKDISQAGRRVRSKCAYQGKISYKQAEE